MPWIRVIDESEATGELAEIYRRLRLDRGNLANIHKIHSLFPRALEAHMDLYKVLMFEEGRQLSRADAEMIATVVSIENSCDYCAAHHGDALAAQNELPGDSSPSFSGEHSDWQLDARQRAMLDLATKLAQTPHAVDEEDITRTKEHGFSDRGILEIVLITSYFCFVNRIALGLGVTTNPEERQGFR